MILDVLPSHANLNRRSSMDQHININFINQFWDDAIMPALIDYIKIPNKSPVFDKDWQAHGFMEQAVTLISNWCQTHALPQMTIEVIRAAERTPLILIEVPGKSDDTVLLYGHLDKQPEMTGWDEGLHPWQPVLRGDKLYGRGGADDGYAAFASLAAIKSLAAQGIPHARLLILIEAGEESGSPDLPYYIDALKDRIGTPNLVVCLDSGCGNYEQLWLTTSLRGLISGNLTISTLKEGVHSGSGSGVAPSCFRILRTLINRIEDESRGDIILSELHAPIPKERQDQAKQAANVLQSSVYKELPLIQGVVPESTDMTDLILRRTWKPALSVIGCDGIPPITDAGNVTLPSLSVKLSMRLPPTCNAIEAANTLKKVLTEHPPYQARVTFDVLDTGSGWNAPKKAPWLMQAINQASLAYFGKDALCMGEGGSIPFMGMLGKQFPQAQFMITGVLGPHSNAHGPNEFLHLPTGKKLTACVAEIIAEHYNSRN